MLNESKKRISKEGFDALRAEILHLVDVLRPKIMEQISIARGHGDLSENAEYHSAKEEQANIDKRIAYLGILQDSSEVIDIATRQKDNRVVFGSKVVLLNLENNKELSVQILGEYDVEIAKSSSIISDTSPLGKECLGQSVGSIVELETPIKTIEYKIISID